MSLADYPPFQPGDPEVAICGCILLDAENVVPMLMAQKRVSPEMFTHPLTQSFMACMWWMIENNVAIDSWTAENRLRDGRFIDDFATISELVAHLVNATPTASHAAHYADRLLDAHLVRTARSRAVAVLADIDAGVKDPGEFARTLPERFMDLHRVGKAPKSNSDVMAEIIQSWEDRAQGIHHITEINTGFADLDAMIQFNTGVHIIAGRPSAGKTSFEGCIMTHNASRGLPVARLSIDMNHRRVLARDLCREAGVSLAKLNKGFAWAFQRSKMTEAADQIGSWPMYIGDLQSVGNNIRAVKTWARMAKLRWGIRALAVDYVQQIRAPDLYDGSNEYGEITHISGEFKNLASELDIPVVLLCQFNRSAERDEGRPRMSDLRGSGALEQDASTILFVYKEPVFNYDLTGGLVDQRTNRAVVFEVAKQQDGEQAAFEYWFQCNYFKFARADKQWGYPCMFDPTVNPLLKSQARRSK
jgi:replicative DNA helicase